MAEIKNFSLVGVGNKIQLGKGGVKMMQAGEAFAFRKSDETTLTNVEVAAPLSANHATTKAYVDSVAQGLDVKQSVRVATTGAITLSGTQTIDGVAVIAGDRVLVKNQVDATQNGIYDVAAGAWARSSDADNTPSNEVSGGLFCFVEEGEVNNDSGWVLSSITGSAVLGTDVLTFSQFSGAGQITAGAGMSKSGNTLDVNVGDGVQIVADAVTVKLDGSTLAVGANGLKVDDATIQRITTAEADINALEQTVATLDKTQIVSPDGLTKVDTDTVDGTITFDAKNGASSYRVATYQAAPAGNTSVTFRTEAGTLKLETQTSDVSGNANLHLQPAGEGHVIIGELGQDTLMQGDDGQNLVIAGGDNAAVGGDLFLRAGNGSTTDGDVYIADGNNLPITQFSTTPGASNRLMVINGTEAVTVGAAGSATDVDLKLNPQGAGKVDASNAIISNVATPVAGTDAVNKDYVDSKAAAETVANKIGSLQTREIAISTATTNVGAVIKGRVRRVMLAITTPYSAGTQLVIGTAQGIADLVDPSQIDETTAGVYDLNVNVNYAVDTQLVATVSGGPTQGAATLIVEYVQA